MVPFINRCEWDTVTLPLDQCNAADAGAVATSRCRAAADSSRAVHAESYIYINGTHTIMDHNRDIALKSHAPAQLFQSHHTEHLFGTD